MTAFTGFPTGKNPFVPIPEVFFTQVLPDIEDYAELKVTLHIFWALANKQGNPRCISDRELISDQILLRSLKRRGDPSPIAERLRQGLEQAVVRGTLLRIHLKHFQEPDSDPSVVYWYFFNTARSRKVVTELEGGEMIPVRLLTPEPATVAVESEQAVVAGVYAKSIPYEPAPTVQVERERPNIFVLYEQNIGLLSPLIADDLRDAADHYPADWIEAAFREAIQQNKRKWSYISAILRRWETEGRQSWNA
ncbi:DnaD domain-containing protein [Tengunoibacter tsumagoiensis]|uniref:Primosomal replication protein N n=1 Tax=Tengunoibacter tsumagoiensis TaxID=2014871 RepID=A0A401ZWE5_9CHLR|nr:DnaD domain protein [Tengunoibacter tsumagoiensis]GCE11231.1 primosomal replication protein N [Tengunoibacter tsumagoiensis]